MRPLVSLWASDSAHHFVACMSAVTVELQWKILPCTASAATGVRADTPAMQQSTMSSRALASAKVPFSDGTIRPLQVTWISPQWVLNFAVEIREDIVWDATYPDTYALSHVTAASREAGAVAVKAEHLKSAKYATLKVNHHFALLPWKHLVCLVRQHAASSGTLGNACTRQQGRTQQGVPPPKNHCCTTEGECCSSARDHREAGGSLLGVTEGAPSPFYVYYQILFLIIATSY